MRPLPRSTARIKRFGKAFPDIRDGEPRRIEWATTDFLMACCGCGLVHRVRFNVRDKWLVLRARREGKLVEETSAQRRASTRALSAQGRA